MADTIKIEDIEERVVLVGVSEQDGDDADWRQHWNRPDMPFYVIELADFLSPEDKGGRAAWAEFRKVQAEVANTNKNVTLIKNGDLGEWNDIHPLDKKTLGQRVSQAVFQQRVK